MTGPIPAYPLSWPAGWKRTPAVHRTSGKFNRKERRSQTHQRADGTTYESSWTTNRDLTINDAVQRVRQQLSMMGIDSDDLVVSTNLELRLDGWPRSGQRQPADPGVAVYWTDAASAGNPPRCMAIDRYVSVADNLAAVAATLEAMRAIERHGGAVILDRAFAGFTALPGPAAVDWREVLDETDPAGSYRRLRSQHHPDNGGDAESFQRIQRAYEQYLQETT